MKRKDIDLKNLEFRKTVISNRELAGSFGKYNRALEHISSLDDWFETWVAGKPWDVPVELDESGVPKRFYFQITEPIPDWVGLVIGDIIHNLRCSLDHLAVAASRKNGNNERDVYFPINAQEEKFLKDGLPKLRKCSKSFIEFVKELKPYKGGNEVLYDLHQLDIIDKHRMLVPVGAIAKIRFRANAGNYGPIDFSKSQEFVEVRAKNEFAALKDGDTLLSFENTTWFPENTEVETEISLSLSFGVETHLFGRIVSSVLHNSLKEVYELLSEAERRFFSE